MCLTVLRKVLVGPVAAAPADATAFDAVLGGLEALAAELQSRRDRVVERARVITASTELRERELIKVASWTAALDSALCGRGLRPPAAAVAAEASIAIFRAAFQRWIEEASEGPLADLVHAGFADLDRFLRERRYS
jgi:hypothetical protein